MVSGKDHLDRPPLKQKAVEQSGFDVSARMSDKYCTCSAEKKSGADHLGSDRLWPRFSFFVFIFWVLWATEVYFHYLISLLTNMARTCDLPVRESTL